VHESIASFEIFCLDFCSEAFGALPGLLCVAGRRSRNDSNDKCRNYENAHLADPWGGEGKPAARSLAETAFRPSMHPAISTNQS
jgi:hypothetical protein